MGALIKTFPSIFIFLFIVACSSPWTFIADQTEKKILIENNSDYTFRFVSLGENTISNLIPGEVRELTATNGYYRYSITIDEVANSKSHLFQNIKIETIKTIIVSSVNVSIDDGLKYYELQNYIARE